MKRSVDEEMVSAITKIAVPMSGAMSDYDAIVHAAKNKRAVLLGEATHGTKEFYRARADITRRLIQDHGFDAVAVEADWPDAYELNRFVNIVPGTTAENAFENFERFPTWMWRNEEVLHFIEWLQAYNRDFRWPGSEGQWPAGFFGLDLYSLSSSISAVIGYLKERDPLAAQRARWRYSCLDHFMDNPQAYGYAAEAGLADSCETEIVSQLIEMYHRKADYLKHNGSAAEDAYFSAAQNARLVHDAERYYRSMFRGRPDSWNVRDQHMFDTLRDLDRYLTRRLGREARIIVWAHNSHVGNAGATEMSERGEFNIGQLARREYGDRALLVGFSTAHGTVTAASDWDEPAEVKDVRPPIPGSYEDVFHQVEYKNFLIDLRARGRAVDLLSAPRLQRAIGVVYRPETERESHYFETRLTQQFDFIIHMDQTSAVHPLTAAIHARKGEMDETYPYGV